MESTYRCSFLNISAAGSGDSSGNGALFRRREADASWIGWTTARHDSERCLVYHKEAWANELTGAELNRRAWVLQERMLAPRVLHFGDTQLFWECQEQEASESFPDGIPLAMKDFMGKSLDPVKYGEKRRAMKLGPKLKWNPPLEGKLGCTYEIWSEIVMRYTSCAITNE